VLFDNHDFAIPGQYDILFGKASQSHQNTCRKREGTSPNEKTKENEGRFSAVEEITIRMMMKDGQDYSKDKKRAAQNAFQLRAIALCIALGILIGSFSSLLTRKRQRTLTSLRTRQQTSPVASEEMVITDLITQQLATIVDVSKIQESSLDAVLKQYGPGPYQVLVTTLKEAYSGEDTETFTLEVIEAAKMPHSVHHFLDMVRLGVWDDTTVVREVDATTSLHALPTSFSIGGLFLSSSKEKIPLGKLPFIETGGYSSYDFCVSFENSRGPDLYIHMDKREETVQDGEEVEVEETSSCFARIIQGVDLLEDLLNGHEDSSDNMRFMGVERMEILSQSSTVIERIKRMHKSEHDESDQE
jgi:cyclophilin family peptidyl-prolyl cis-trans isomerase